MTLQCPQKQLALRSELNQMRIQHTLMQQENVAKHEHYRQRFQTAAEHYKQEAREVTNVEIAQSQAQMNARYSSAMLQAEQEIHQTQGLAEVHVQHVKTIAQAELEGAQQLIVQQAEHHVKTQRDAVVSEAKEALTAKDKDIQQQQQSLIEEARLFATQEQNQVAQMQQELQMRNRALNETITRASGDAELISDLQDRLRDSELQCHSLQSVLHERKNERAAKDNTLHQSQQRLTEELMQSQRSSENRDRA